MIDAPASIVIQPTLSQDSAFARRTKRLRAVLAFDATGADTTLVLTPAKR
jgi:hypothetical protein